MIFVSTILSVQAKLFELFKNKMFNLDLIYAWIYFEQESSKILCCPELSVLTKQKNESKMARTRFCKRNSCHKNTGID